ncbi:hypothetical protein [Bacillus cereus]|uniref:hypothetical protein n=1 Tax=Bacillus cereus TaxID=1396 RepID=UPI000C28D047|nr:hypothetical protein [Bacillus cereus]
MLKKNDFLKIGAVALSASILAGGVFTVTSHAQETTNSNYIVKQSTQSDVELIVANTVNKGDDKGSKDRDKRHIVTSARYKWMVSSFKLENSTDPKKCKTNQLQTNKMDNACI